MKVLTPVLATCLICSVGYIGALHKQISEIHHGISEFARVSELTLTLATRPECLIPMPLEGE